MMMIHARIPFSLSPTILICCAALSCGHQVEPKPISKLPANGSGEQPQPQANEDTSPAHGLSLAELLKTGEKTANLLGFGASQRTDELIARSRQAMQKQADWFQDYIKNQPPGQPLPYHPNFGMSEDDYAEMMRGLKEMSVRDIGDARLTILDKGNGIIAFNGDERVAALNSVTINTKTLTVNTPFATLTANEQVSSREGSPLGSFDALLWKYSERSAEDGAFVSVKFGVGRLLQDGRTFIDYRVKSIRQDRQLERVDVLIQFESSARREE